jgi:site-specific DNA-methyltransferase (adenine-specific)
MVWDKEWIGPGGQRGLRPSYELVALWAMPDFAIADRSIYDIQRFKWSSHKPNGHPAEKPEGLMQFCIEHGAPDGGVVLDPFTGSGTTGVACLRTGRRFVGIEIDAGYYRVACDRIRREWETQQGGPMFAPSATPTLFAPAEAPESGE